MNTAARSNTNPSQVIRTQIQEGPLTFGQISDATTDTTIESNANAKKYSCGVRKISSSDEGVRRQLVLRFSDN
jgi:hypothetical protein